MMATVGRCACGCGAITPIANRTDAARGWVRGQRIPFAFRHVLRTRRIDVRARFESFIEKTDGCWEWTGGVQSSGYGTFNVPETAGGGSRLAHRFSYELHVGPIPAGLEIDHLCRNRRCVRPDHLDAVTHRENDMRGASPAIVARREGRCITGRHAMTPANTRHTASGRQRCRACEREWSARRRRSTN
jgi:hypothetical protein